MDAATPLLSVDRLTIDIGGANVVDDVSFTVAPGKVMALVGESGCGKSLTSYAMLGLLPPAARRTAGRIMLENTDLAALSERQFRKARGKDISIIFQEPSASLDPLTTVGSQIARLTGSTTASPGRRPMKRRGRCWSMSASPTRHGGWTSIRSNCPAACASAS